MGQETIFATFKLRLLFTVDCSQKEHAMRFGFENPAFLTMNKKQQTKKAVTLIEMLIVVVIIAILTTMVIGIAGRIDNQAKKQLVENTIAIINAALQQFQDYDYSYKHPDYAEFDFPLDCHRYDFSGILPLDLQITLGNALGTTVIISNHDDRPKHLDYHSCEVMYFFLSKVPECRKTLNKIDRSLVTNLNEDGAEIGILIGPQINPNPLFRIIDPWEQTLRYDYYDEITLDPYSKRNFPLITSAGPDTFFGTPDDITSR